MRSLSHRLAAAAAAAALALSAVACGSSGSSTGSAPGAAGRAAFPAVIKTANGVVHIRSRPTTIISLSPTATEMLYAIGAGSQVKAVDSDSDYPPQAPMTKLSGLVSPGRHAACRRPEGITVAGQRRIRTGFAEICAILGHPRGSFSGHPGQGYSTAAPARCRWPRVPGACALSPGVASSGPLRPWSGSGLRCHKAAVRTRARAPGSRAAADG